MWLLGTSQFVSSALLTLMMVNIKPAQAHKQHFLPPGDTPFRLCQNASETDLFTFDRVELFPKPVLMDQVFHINVYGTLSQDIDANSTVKVHGVYENAQPGRTFTFNFCDTIVSINQPGNCQCPPKKGDVLVVFEGYTSPWDLSFGHFNWTFEAFTPDNERLFCVQADVCLDRGDGHPGNQGACPPVKDRSSMVGSAQQALHQ